MERRTNILQPGDVTEPSRKENVSKCRKFSQTSPKFNSVYNNFRLFHNANLCFLVAYIYGGYNGNDIFGDLWRLDLDTLAWKKLPNDMTEPAYFHGTTITPVRNLIELFLVYALLYLRNKSRKITKLFVIFHTARPTVFIWWSYKHRI